MQTRWIVFAGVLFLNTIMALNLAFRIARKRSAPGCISAVYMFIALAIWAFSYGMTALTVQPDLKLFWLKMENIGIVSVPVFWFFFTTQYTQRDKWLTRPVQALFWVIPFITLFLLFSDRWITTYYLSFIPFTPNGGPFIVGKGSWYFVQLVQTYLIIAVGTLMLVWHVFQFRDIYRQQIILVLVALAVPWLVNVFYQIGATIFPSIYIPIDLTAIFFTITAALISVAVFGLQLFDMVPIARNSVMESISEMVLVIDASDRVLDVNRAARLWLKKNSKEIIGSNISVALSAYPRILARYFAATSAHDEVEIPDSPPRMFEIKISPLYARFGTLEGRVIVARDITERKNMETDLMSANESLKAQLAEIEVLQDKLREQAVRDSLTGVYNRRFLAESLDGVVARAERDKKPISVVVMDIDHFKTFNDRFGHKCGDMVLQSLAKLLCDHTKNGDIVCRYGGEEFVVLMPNTTLDQAFECAESWRSVFEADAIKSQGQLLQATFSAGVASFPLHGTNGEAILQAADHAMYRSKANGRNLVTISSGETHPVVESL
jgi:diguanylate cyclase (GGDEF)-like protein/PAS domain S-box-containing protein